MAFLRASSTQHNRLLSSLPERDRARLERYLEPITLKRRQRLEAANRKIEHACFVEEGLVSIVAVEPSKRRQVEIALIGHEGLTGIPLILGAESSPLEALVQVEGRVRQFPQASWSDCRCMNR